MEATSRQKVCSTSLSTGDQGGVPTLVTEFEMKLTFLK